MLSINTNSLIHLYSTYHWVEVHILCLKAAAMRRPTTLYTKYTSRCTANELKKHSLAQNSIVVAIIKANELTLMLKGQNIAEISYAYASIIEILSKIHIDILFIGTELQCRNSALIRFLFPSTQGLH